MGVKGVDDVNQGMMKLLELLQIEDVSHFESGVLESMSADNVMGEWFFDIRFERALPLVRYRDFTNRLKNLPERVKTVKVVDYCVTFEQFGEAELVDYYDFSLDELIAEDRRATPIKDYLYDVEDRTITIKAPSDAKSVQLYQDTIAKQLRKNGCAATILIRLDEEKKSIQDQIAKTQAQFVQSNLSSEPARFDYLHPDRLIEGSATPIVKIPRNAIELEDHKAKNKGKAVFVLRGIVVTPEVKVTRSRTYLSFIVTDKIDSIFVRRAVTGEDEKRFADQIKDGLTVLVEGLAQVDDFTGEVTIQAYNIAKSSDILQKTDRLDEAKEKRIELHLHTKMSPLDGVNTMEEYVLRAKHWGHPAIAVTDHGGVQSFPELFHLSKTHGVKGLYGLELTFVNDEKISITREASSGMLSDLTYCVFDIETSGLSVLYDRIIEIAGVKIKNGQTLGTFQTYINPLFKINDFTVGFTGITQSKLQNAPLEKDALVKFLEFSKDCVLVAHNASFDVDFLYESLVRSGVAHPLFPVIDTLTLAKALYPDRAYAGLNNLAKWFKVPNPDHHSALNDARTLTEIFQHLLQDVRKEGVYKYADLNRLIRPDLIHKIPFPKHVNLLVAKQEGLKNLYKVLSIALTEQFDREAKIRKSTLDKYKKGLLIGSGCRNSDFFEIVMTKNHAAALEAAKYYDYLEVQPPSTFANLRFDNPDWQTQIEDAITRIVSIGKELSIPVVATGDVHHLDPEDLIYREIMIQTPLVGGGFHKLNGEKEKPSQHYLTTKEMLAEFAFLGEETAYEIVVTNTQRIAETCDAIQIFPKELYAPTDEFLAEKGVPSIKVKVNQMVRQKAAQLYGEPLPGIVSRRMEKELKSIIDHQFATIYYISHLLVRKSLDDGYLVGSRGSVGSSLVATFMDITEVNPLPPHYRCPQCRFSAFKKTEEDKQLDPLNEFEIEHQKWLEHVDCGYDLPDMKCPVCGAPMKKDGHDIPFETFLGFKGDKVPDIDLNFSGDYQAKVHLYIRTLFGENYAFRAGTIGTCAAKTAFGMVKAYFEEKDKADPDHPTIKRKAEIERLAQGIVGSKRTSGQHPGGIVVVPNDKEIFDITPIQYPGDSTDREWKTTHFDYHSFESNLFKLDVLGHDDPTMIRYLMDIVKKNPLDYPFSKPEDIPVDDKEVYRLLAGTDVIGLSPEDIRSEVASFGVPELGTDFVRGMLRDTRPRNFAELVKISGLSHGTDVWNSNAQDLVLGRNKLFGRVEFKDIIGCRDDIMVDLIDYGMAPTMAFEIMEFVRKGKAPANPEKWATYADKMRASNVPDWYIWSCSKIKYMFPKAHATAYVLMAMRIAWFKLHRPIVFYSAYFSKRAAAFDVEAFMAGEKGIERKLDQIADLGKEATVRDAELETVLQIALEMTKRGFSFRPINIHESLATEFKIVDAGQALLIPFIALESLGEAAAKSVVEAREIKPFLSKEDVKTRTKLTKTLLERLDELGAMDDLMEESQMSLFDL